MIAIQIRFPSGRFHATPWGRHVNEGAAEWPPAPWRFLRALIAAWKRKLDDRLAQEQVEPLLRALAEPPAFRLPPASAGHARHYMPWGKKGPDDRTMVFDAFVALDRQADIIMLWESANLDDEQRAHLALILDHLNFLGRAESWCDARLLDAETVAVPNCIPINGQTLSSEYEVVRVLCPDPESAFSGDKFVPQTGRTRRKKSAPPAYDPNWHLCAETLWLHAERWSDPPGSKWIRYARPVDCLKVTPARKPAIARHPAGRVQVVRYVLDSAVLPLVTETLPVAEATRAALMSIYGRRYPESDGSKGRSRTFSGKDAQGNKLLGHTHAYYLPTDEDGDGRLDHLTLAAAGGFSDHELRAIDRLTEIMRREREESGHPLRTLLLGMGPLDEYASPPPLKPSKEWVSATPFLVTRHPKRRGKKRDPRELLENPIAFVEALLREELERKAERDPAWPSGHHIRIEARIDEGGHFKVGPQKRLRPIQFKRFRQKRGDDGGVRLAGAFRLVFPEPVAGPICLGHS